MEDRVHVLIMNADEQSKERIKSCPESPLYNPDISSSYNESLEKLKKIRYGFVVVYVNSHGDLTYMDDARRLSPSSHVIAITGKDPTSEIDWDRANGMIRMCDYLEKAGAKLVVGNNQFAGGNNSFGRFIDGVILESEQPKNP